MSKAILRQVAARLQAHTEQAGVPEVLTKLSAPKLKSIINNAVKSFDLDEGWKAAKTNDTEELIEQINEMCNEHRLSVDEKTGALKKS